MIRMHTLPWLVMTLLYAGSALAEDTRVNQMKRAQTPMLGAPAQAARDDIKNTFGFVPGFLNVMPEQALPGAWEEMKSLQMNPNTALPGKIKELIGLGVAAQVPCSYCTYAHTQFAKLEGATDAEIGEAVVVASLTRHWSTVLQGVQTDLGKWRDEITKWISHIKKSAGQAPAGQSMPVVDANTAMQEIQKTFGSVPEFMRKFPPEALAGAWKELRDVELNPNTALSAKHKSLIGLAVASQIPCQFCVVADTEFAKLEGASEREISEAIALAAITRHWSTYVNGMQIDQAGFRRDIDRLVKNAKRQAANSGKTEAATAAAMSTRQSTTAAMR